MWDNIPLNENLQASRLQGLLSNPTNAKPLLTIAPSPDLLHRSRDASHHPAARC
jgi:hypothetical protein